MKSSCLAVPVCWVLLACGPAEDEEAAAYAELEAVYEITRVERYLDACEADGAPIFPSGTSPYWVAYTVARGLPDVQLHAHGCTSVEHCRDVAHDVKADGSLDESSYIDFVHHVYSRVSSSGAIDGVGVTLAGDVDGSCRLLLEETSIEPLDDEVRFRARYRLGAEYEAEADGRCAERDDLSAGWRTWTEHDCTRFDVIRTRRIGPL